MVFWGLSVGASHYSERYYIQSGDQALVLRTSLQSAQTDGWWRHLNEESEKEAFARARLPSDIEDC
jgi:hypothetical protein